MAYKALSIPSASPMLTAVLDVYCQTADMQNGTNTSTPVLISLYRRGATTATSLAMAVENMFRGEERSLEND